MTRAVLNGWGINSIYQFLAGNPLWVSQATDGENNGGLIDPNTAKEIAKQPKLFGAKHDTAACER